MIMANASLRVLPVRSVMISQTSDTQCEGGWICWIPLTPNQTPELCEESNDQSDK